MKCQTCGKSMKAVRGIPFNDFKVDGWKCACGKRYYDPDQAQKILVLNKLKGEVIKAKLGKIRSNLILRLPRDLEYALGLEKGEDVVIRVEDGGFKIVPAQPKNPDLCFTS